jgi:hypothetical protein
MRLAQYLDERRISDAQFARDLGVAHSLVHCWRYRTKTPSLEMAQRVRIATSGLVAEHDWLDDPVIAVSAASTA